MLEFARTLGLALLAATMEGCGYLSEATRQAQLRDRRPPVLTRAHGHYPTPPRGVNSLVPPDTPLAPPVQTVEGRDAERCVRQIFVALVSSLCHRIWSPAALHQPAWLLPEGYRLEDFVPSPAVPTLTATAAAALPAPLQPRPGSTDWMDSYAALARAPLSSYLLAIVKGAPASFSTVVLCLYYLETAAARGHLTGDGPLAQYPPRLVVLAYMSLAAKYTLDTPGSCRTWGRIGGVPPMVLSQAELAILSAHQFELFVAPVDFLRYTRHLAADADHLAFAGQDAAAPVPAKRKVGDVGSAAPERLPVHLPGGGDPAAWSTPQRRRTAPAVALPAPVIIQPTLRTKTGAPLPPVPRMDPFLPAAAWLPS